MQAGWPASPATKMAATPHAFDHARSAGRRTRAPALEPKFEPLFRDSVATALVPLSCSIY